MIHIIIAYYNTLYDIILCHAILYYIRLCYIIPCVYTYIYIYIYIFMYMCVYIYIYIRTHTHIGIDIPMDTYKPLEGGRRGHDRCAKARSLAAVSHAMFCFLFFNVKGVIMIMITIIIIIIIAILLLIIIIIMYGYHFNNLRFDKSQISQWLFSCMVWTRVRHCSFQVNIWTVGRWNDV